MFADGGESVPGGSLPTPVYVGELRVTVTGGVVLPGSLIDAFEKVVD